MEYSADCLYRVKLEAPILEVIGEAMEEPGVRGVLVGPHDLVRRTGITMVVLPVLVYGMTGSPAWVASLALIEFVPYLGFGLLAGAVADRVNRKKIMVGCDVTAAFLLAAVPAAAAFHLLGMAQVLIVALGIATAYVWFDAANFGTLPVLVDRAELPVAASLIGSSGQVAFLCAPTIGAALLTVMRPPYALGFDAASYLVSALLLMSIRRPFRRPQHEPDRLRIRADIGEGLRFLWRQPVIRTHDVLGLLRVPELGRHVRAARGLRRTGHSTCREWMCDSGCCTAPGNSAACSPR